MRLARQVARFRQKNIITKKRTFEGTGIDEGQILKWIQRKIHGKQQTGLG
jgi:hypothetical protein